MKANDRSVASMKPAKSFNDNQVGVYYKDVSCIIHLDIKESMQDSLFIQLSEVKK